MQTDRTLPDVVDFTDDGDDPLDVETEGDALVDWSRLGELGDRMAAVDNDDEDAVLELYRDLSTGGA